MQLLIIMCLFSIGLGQIDDCLEQCSCQKQYIFCTNLYHQPRFFVAEPQSVIGIYINVGYLRSLHFVNYFPNLQFVALDKVQISCEVVWNISIPVLGTHYSGKFFFLIMSVLCFNFW